MDSVGLRYFVPLFSSCPRPSIILREPLKKSWTATRATGSKRLKIWSSSTATSVVVLPDRAPPFSILAPSPSPSSMSTKRLAMPDSERCLTTARVPCGQRREALLDLERHVGPAVGVILIALDRARGRAADLDLVALHQLPRVEEAGGHLVAAAAAEQEEGHEHGGREHASQSRLSAQIRDPLGLPSLPHYRPSGQRLYPWRRGRRPPRSRRAQAAPGIVRCVASPAIEVSDLRKSYGAGGGRARRVLRGPARRGVRPARAQRRGQDHHRRDPRGLPRALGRRGARARAPTPPPGARELKQRVGIVLQSCGLLSPAHRARGGGARGQGLPLPPRRRRDDLDGRAGRRARTRAPTGCRAASSGGWTSRSRSSATRSWCSSTSPPPASTPPPGARPGTWCARCASLGKTVLLTTHYLDEAQALADRVAIVKDGEIVAEGAPDSLTPGQRGLPRLLRVAAAAGSSTRPTTPPTSCTASPATPWPAASACRRSRWPVPRSRRSTSS